MASKVASRLPSSVVRQLSRVRASVAPVEGPGRCPGPWSTASVPSTVARAPDVNDQAVQADDTIVAGHRFAADRTGPGVASRNHAATVALTGRRIAWGPSWSGSLEYRRGQTQPCRIGAHRNAPLEEARMTPAETVDSRNSASAPVRQMPPVGLSGRERELGVLNGIVDQLGDGAGGALVVRGDPGIGKSTLLAAATARARDQGMQSLSAGGVQSEAHIPFAGVHQLLGPMLHMAEHLPAPQRAALLAAFGRSDEVGTERYLVALATLELLGDRFPARRSCWSSPRTRSGWIGPAAPRWHLSPERWRRADRDAHREPRGTRGPDRKRRAGRLRLAASTTRRPGRCSIHKRELASRRAGTTARRGGGNPLALVELPGAGDGGARGPAAPPFAAAVDGASGAGIRCSGPACHGPTRNSCWSRPMTAATSERWSPRPR